MNFVSDIAGFYIYELPVLIVRTIKNLILYFVRKSGLNEMLANIFAPLFGQSGLWSHLSGFLFRSLFISLLLSGLIGLTLGIFLGIYGIVFSLYIMLTKAVPLLILIPALLVLLRVYYLYTHPILSAKKVATISDAKRASYIDGAHILGYLEHHDYRKIQESIMDSEIVSNFVLRTELDSQKIHDFLAENLHEIKVTEFMQNLTNLISYTNARFITIEIIFTAVLITLPGISEFLELQGFSQQFLRDTLKYTVSLTGRSNNFWQDDFNIPANAGIDRSWSLGYSQVTNKFSEDFTKTALEGNLTKIIGRDEVKADLIDVLSKTSRKNALIIGDPGSGKTTFVKGIASEIALAKVPPALKNKRIIALELGKLFSGSFSEINTALTSMLKEMQKNNNIILFIDEIQNLVTSHSTDPNHSFILSTLEPYLSEGKIQFIGACTENSYTKYIEPNGSIAKSFSLVKLRETNFAETLELLEIKGKSLEKNGTVVTYKFMISCIELSKKFIHTSVLPDKACDLMDKAASRLKITGVKILNKEFIEKIISESFGVPISSISANESEKLLNLEDEFHQRVIGQDQAISEVVKALKRARVNVRDDKKPIASFLFCGPTGVGKTETAKTLAKVYYGSENLMVRLDMSEFQDPYSVKRLIGDEFGNIGILTSKIKSKPYSLILIDEIEKAHKNVVNAFLQVLDDGRLTDFGGTTVDFSNALLIFTSNVGSKDIFDSLKHFDRPDINAVAMKALENYYPPEFLNRFTRVVVYKPLEQTEIAKIIMLKLKNVADKLYDLKKVRIHFTPDTVDMLVKEGFSIEYGARSINRVIEDKVETYLADKILRGELKPGNTLSI